jgi:UDP-2,3-diacylglucosamine pyrophosphatase LpxH
MAAVIWTPEEVALLIDMRPTASLEEIRIALLSELSSDRSRKAISRKCEKLGLRYQHRGQPKNKKLSIYLDHREKTNPSIKESTIKQNKDAKETVKNWLDLLLSVENDWALDFISYEQPVTSSKNTVSLVISDCHFGRYYNDSTDRFTYNVDIAQERFKIMGNKFVAHIRDNDKDIDEVVIMLLGDIVDGHNIYKTQKEEQDKSPLLQIHYAVESIWGLIQYVYQTFPDKTLRIVAVLGNHGRIATQTITNWDNIAYQELELATKIFNKSNTTRPISFIVRFEDIDYITTQIKGHTFVLRHVAPVHADSPANRDKFKGWKDFHKADALVFGHYHHAGYFTCNGFHIIRNGSLIGGDPFAEQLGLYDEPTQVIITTNEDSAVASIHLVEI